jgi:hypothetical protein
VEMWRCGNVKIKSKTPMSPVIILLLNKELFNKIWKCGNEIQKFPASPVIKCGDVEM